MKSAIIFLALILLFAAGCLGNNQNANPQNKTQNGTNSANTSNLAKGHLICALTYDIGKKLPYNLSEINVTGEVEICQGNKCEEVGKIEGDITKLDGVLAEIGKKDVDPGHYEVRLKIDKVTVTEGRQVVEEKLPAIGEYTIGEIEVSPGETTVIDIGFKGDSLVESDPTQTLTPQFETIIIDVSKIEEKIITIDGESVTNIDLKGQIESITDTNVNTLGESKEVNISIPSEDIVHIVIKDESDLTTGLLIKTDGEIETITETAPFKEAVETILAEISTETNIPVDKLAEETNIVIIDDIIENEKNEVLSDAQSLLDQINNAALHASEQNVIKDEAKLSADIALAEQKINADPLLTSAEKSELISELNNLTSELQTPTEIEHDISQLETTITTDSQSTTNPTLEHTILENDLQAVEHDLQTIEHDETSAVVDQTLLHQVESELQHDEQTLIDDTQNFETIIDSELSVETGMHIAGTESDINNAETIVSHEETVVEHEIESGGSVEISASASTDSGSTSVSVGTSSSESSTSTSVSTSTSSDTSSVSSSTSSSSSSSSSDSSSSSSVSTSTGSVSTGTSLSIG